MDSETMKKLLKDYADENFGEDDIRGAIRVIADIFDFRLIEIRDEINFMIGDYSNEEQETHT